MVACLYLLKFIAKAAMVAYIINLATVQCIATVPIVRVPWLIDLGVINKAFIQGSTA